MHVPHLYAPSFNYNIYAVKVSTNGCVPSITAKTRSSNPVRKSDLTPLRCFSSLPLCSQETLGWRQWNRHDYVKTQKENSMKIAPLSKSHYL